MALLIVSGAALAVVAYVRLVPDRESTIENDDAGTVTATDDVDTADDEEWISEETAEEAGTQLKHLLALLDTENQLDIAALQEIAANDVKSTQLRPTTLEQRFKTRTLVVRRGDVNPDDLKSGTTELRKRLDELAAPLAGADNLHNKSKVISVEQLSEKTVRTDVIVQRAGDMPFGSLQQDAVWTCDWNTQNSDGAGLKLTHVALKEYEETEFRAANSHIFSDCTEAVFENEPSFRKQLIPGIDYWRSLTQKQYGVYLFGHHGIAVGDVNGDGLDDIYAGQPGGLPNRLYLQNEDGTVKDIAPEAGVDLLNRTQGVLLIDADNDGDQDLIAVLDELIIFMANDGTARFSEVNSIPTTNPGALSAADFDNDGDLDIYVVNYGDRFRSHPEIYHDANNGGANVMLRNDGNWQFSDVTADVELEENNTRWSFAASWEDFDDDGDQDLYVANDFGRNNFYRNNGGKFEDVAPELQVEDIAAGMSASWADYDHDGRMDLYVGNMFSSAGLRVTGQSRFQKSASAAVRDDFRRHARGNSLFRNTGDGPFQDVSVEAGVTVGRWAWASKFVDINNDTWEDLVVANGFVTSHQTQDL